LNTFKKRIDELGRIVIPKEIRKTYKINNYDELELKLDDNKIIVTKTLGLNLYKKKINNYIKLIYSICNLDILIIENDLVVASSNENLSGKININFDNNNLKQSFLVGNNTFTNFVYIDKIIYDSNLLGYILFINDNEFKDINLLKQIKNVLIDLIN